MKSEKYLIVASQKDVAGRNIANIVINKFNFRRKGNFEGYPVFEKENIRLIFCASDIIFADYIDKFFRKEDCYVFVSRHKSEKGVPCLTTHAPGNFSNDTSYGGNQTELGSSDANFMKNALI